tara:strand:- start:290 stop:700 length:411 start_codon:yes stop_codon:yes gene_type:complete
MIGVICENLISINLEKFCDNNITIFSSSQTIKDIDNMSLFSTYMSYHFEGILLATTMNDSLLFVNNSTCKKKVFWVSEAEWYKFSPLLYKDLLKIFCSNDIKILAQNKEIFNILESFIRKPDGIMESIDIKKIMEI